MSGLELSNVIADIDRFEDTSHSSGEEEVVMPMYDRARKRESGWRVPGVGNLTIIETLVPSEGKEIGTPYEMSLNFTETPVGTEKSVGETESTVELRADYYAADGSNAFFVLREQGSEDYESRSGVLEVFSNLPDGKTLDVVDLTKDKIGFAGPPHSSCYLTLEFAVAPDAFEE